MKTAYSLAFDNLPEDAASWRARPKHSLLRTAGDVHTCKRRLVALVKEAVLEAINGNLALTEVENFIDDWMKREKTT